ncbi:ExbD/TolR family protein [Verrucomicrobiota bacterium]
MPRKRSLAALKELSEISYTPLIDLSMLLLVTFIITYPLMEQGIHVALPRGKADELEPLLSRTITLDIKGKLYLDDAPMSLAQLTTEMRLLGTSDLKSTVYVRADKGLNYGRVVEVMRVLHDAEISRMALVTKAE